MSNAEQASEPSMEDILSSIRKIIAEEPAVSTGGGGGDGDGDGDAGEGAEFAPTPDGKGVSAVATPAVESAKEPIGGFAEESSQVDAPAAAGKSPSPFDALVAASNNTPDEGPAAPAVAPTVAQASTTIPVTPAVEPAAGSPTALAQEPSSLPLPASKPFNVAALANSTSAKPPTSSSPVAKARPGPVETGLSGQAASGSVDDLMDMFDDAPISSSRSASADQIDTVNQGETAAKVAPAADKSIEPVTVPQMNLPPVASSFVANEPVTEPAPSSGGESAFDAPKPAQSTGPLVSRLEAPETESESESVSETDTQAMSDAADTETDGDKNSEGNVDTPAGHSLNGSAIGADADVKDEPASDDAGAVPPLSTLLSNLSGGVPSDDAPTPSSAVVVSSQAEEPEADEDDSEAISVSSGDAPASEAAKSTPAVPVSSDVSTLEELLGTVNTAPVVVKADALSQLSSVNGLAADDGDLVEKSATALDEADSQTDSDKSAPEADVLATIAPVAAAVPALAATSGTEVVADLATVRTMEDTVSELLRPMLRDWLDANMPRIVEKALKVEMASVIPAVTVVPVDDDET